MNLRLWSILVITLILGQFSISNAFAYIDPGSGSMILQMLIGTLLGAGIVVKLYWQKIRMKIRMKFMK
tara:strand:- start:150 stop:353 length:204 start_codon:yes stop_codon:yes gene_type:complete